MPHKMDSEYSVCMHNKAHGPMPKVLAHGQPWICRLCGEEGNDSIITMVAPDFQVLQSKKSQGGFHAAR